MSDFAIVTDTAAELLEELSVKLDIHMIPMEFTMSGVSYQHDAGYRQMDAKTFYRRLRDGEMATTSAINPGQYVEYLTPILAGGQDVLLLVFSSGLSSTYQKSLPVDLTCGSIYVILWHKGKLHLGLRSLWQRLALCVRTLPGQVRYKLRWNPCIGCAVIEAAVDAI